MEEQEEEAGALGRALNLLCADSPPSCVAAHTRTCARSPHPRCVLQFHLEQAKSRTQRRMESGRPKAIDLLAHTLFQLEGMEPQQVNAPPMFSPCYKWPAVGGSCGSSWRG